MRPKTHAPYPAAPIVRVYMVREAPFVVSPGAACSSPQNVSDLLDSYRSSDREVFLCLHLDSKHHVLGVEEVSRGTLNAAIVHPREVFKGALLSNAASIIVAHNHPSGDPTPSEEDRQVTRRLKEAGTLLGIPLLDHVILGSEGLFFSMPDQQEPTP